jgi:UDP-2-acetamido-3-amino-2,3-dideoxy-glucuronate N-acetyltransferase
VTSPPRVAVIGCGMWGRNHVRTFADLGALAAVHDQDEVAAQAMASQHGVPARRLDAILSDEDIDAVVVAAPAVRHHELASAALEAGKHVLVEKPIALDVADAERLCVLADSNDRVLMVGHLLQYHPAFLALREVVEQGELGRLQYVYSNRLNFGRFRREENALWSFAPHDISMILTLTGEEPSSVTAVGASFLHGVVADVTTTHLAFPSGVRGHVFVSWLHPYKEQKLIVVGDRGMAVFDDGQPWGSKLIVYPHQVDWHDGLPHPAKADARPVPVAPHEPLVAEDQHFLDCCAAGSRPLTDGREGVRVLRVLQAAQRSLGDAARAVPSAQTHPGAIVHETAVVDEPSVIGAGTRIWHFTHVLAGSHIGEDCNIGQNVCIGPDVTIGDRCKIQNNVSVYPGVTLEDGVFCGPSSVFTNVVNPRAEVDRKDELAPTLVRRGASVGANATIVCGHTLGAYCFVAAGAVVTQDVPDYALVAGVPAKRIGWVSAAGERLGDDLVCKRTGQRYREVGPDLLEALDE